MAKCVGEYVAGLRRKSTAVLHEAMGQLVVEERKRSVCVIAVQTRSTLPAMFRRRLVSWSTRERGISASTAALTAGGVASVHS